jgi:diguanylate cyclase (GGDEF)-like protein/PAS domain S-box-containing protein
MAEGLSSPSLLGRRERARALAYLFLGGATLPLLTIAFLALPADTSVPGSLVLVSLALITGAVRFWGADRLPAWFAPVALAFGTVLVGGDVYFAGTIGVNNEMLYVLVAFYAFYFLPGRVALAEIAFVGATYAVALMMRSEANPAARWLLTMGTLVLAGVLMATLVARLERMVRRLSEREEKLRQAEERFRSSFDDAPIGMAIVGLDGRWVRVNQAFAHLTGYGIEQLVGMSFQDLTPPEDLVHDLPALDALVSGQQSTHHAEKRYVRADGEIVWVLLTVSVVHDSAGQPVHMISQMQDVTARKTAEDELAERALHDPLTGLPNRILFADRVEVALARIERTSAPLAVFFVDLDRFKLVNDSLGHAIGDRMLLEVGKRLIAVVRPADTVSRFGGDEFTILCENTDKRAASVVAKRILDALATPIVVDGHELFASASIGIAVGVDHRAKADEMLRDADAAMYRAKEQGHSRFALFDGGLRLQATERLELENDLRRAIERDELFLLYQPDVDLATGEIHGVEALVRWQHPHRGRLSPHQFIPIAEESGLIAGLGEWVVAEACRQLRSWHDEGHPLSVSVNISPRQLADPNLPNVIHSALDSSGANPAALCLEITESAAVEAGSVTLAALRGRGVRLALDDFGAGFSSLHQIRRLPQVDTLKIDRSFVEELGRHPADTAILAAIVGMARALRMVTVAEGIQNEAQARTLREIGCDRGQGYHFGCPLGAQAIVELAPAAALGELVGS